MKLLINHADRLTYKVIVFFFFLVKSDVLSGNKQE